MLLSLLQVNIEDKIKNAPDDNYQIGILIGSYLPLFILVVLAYLLYRFNKNRNKES
ncbi:hypothetical protein V6251_13405 [Olleya sp. Ti.3.14]|uniref:hypothetical protein n=1 Tax=Olleya sp. Ti.3.14 TaxID=3121297 RepID=UPI00312011E9